MDHAHIQHLYHRASFGIRPDHSLELEGLDRAQVVENLFSDSKSTGAISTEHDPTAWVGFKGKSQGAKNKILREERMRIQSHDAHAIECALGGPNGLWRDRVA